MKRHREYEKALGKKIKLLREDKKLSQGELGYLAGVSQNQISRLENAKGGVTVYSLISIAAALGCDPSELIKVDVKLEFDKGKKLSLIKRLPITPTLRKVLASDFLLTPRSIKEIVEYCESELNVALRSGSISGALKRLAEKGLVHRLPAPKKGDFLYQKHL
ncbi:transcriptional regulator [Pontibacter sp. Tf4]|uniref:helix-turn-helix domain-containing protein n=1 Tax=Pontibacter sp. Tf4 TaxID=2761620 RepID=UPI001626F2B4|nr:transcriptional regulator [Pontibacter sp. Tf4]